MYWDYVLKSCPGELVEREVLLIWRHSTQFLTCWIQPFSFHRLRLWERDLIRGRAGAIKKINHEHSLAWLSHRRHSLSLGGLFKCVWSEIRRHLKVLPAIGHSNLPLARLICHWPVLPASGLSYLFPVTVQPTQTIIIKRPSNFTKNNPFLTTVKRCHGYIETVSVFSGQQLLQL